MPAYHDELLNTARVLLNRGDRQRGRLPQARVRRSISTAYYAIFHFLLEDAALRIVGTHHPLQVRRRTFVRLFTHTGMLTALNKIKGRSVQEDVAPFLRWGSEQGPLPVPDFARTMARVFADAQSKRHDADYNLNSVFLASDAAWLIDRVSHAMLTWNEASDAHSRDFKHALALLMLQKGNLRSAS